ncbi:hypothetical protein A2Z22_02430 [Candidatus Woesebacteria bacterium RBG_16_34_12]|uniref:Uncharacterized protein n=1 Tax=Candidatus Woesebacteria bacterium RBG_16_34_12 TaxID=1802480 RepID=A0A1F7X9D4_9BACT|nr:MAG: hypothetical protein A2Z22_02430 [Candidatus Woesebacteria bacterium RBG_16_34_12]
MNESGISGEGIGVSSRHAKAGRLMKSFAGESTEPVSTSPVSDLPEENRPGMEERSGFRKRVRRRLGGSRDKNDSTDSVPVIPEDPNRQERNRKAGLFFGGEEPVSGEPSDHSQWKLRPSSVPPLASQPPERPLEQAEPVEPVVEQPTTQPEPPTPPGQKPSGPAAPPHDISQEQSRPQPPRSALRKLSERMPRVAEPQPELPSTRSDMSREPAHPPHSSAAVSEGLGHRDVEVEKVEPGKLREGARWYTVYGTGWDNRDCGYFLIWWDGEKIYLEQIVSIGGEEAVVNNQTSEISSYEGYNSQTDVEAFVKRQIDRTKYNYQDVDYVKIIEKIPVIEKNGKFIIQRPDEITQETQLPLSSTLEPQEELDLFQQEEPQEEGGRLGGVRKWLRDRLGGLGRRGQGIETPSTEIISEPPEEPRQAPEVATGEKGEIEKALKRLGRERKQRGGIVGEGVPRTEPAGELVTPTITPEEREVPPPEDFVDLSEEELKEVGSAETPEYLGSSFTERDITDIEPTRHGRNIRLPFSGAARNLRERVGNISFRRRRREIETDQQLSEFLYGIRGKEIDRANKRGRNIPVALFGGLATGLAKGGTKAELLEKGLDVTAAASFAAAGFSVLRDTAHILTSDEDAIAALAKRYVTEEPGSRLGKLGWYTRIAERTFVEKITRTKLVEGSAEERVLSFFNDGLQTLTPDERVVVINQEYVKKAIEQLDKEREEADWQHIVAMEVAAYGFLTDTKTKNAYRDLGKELSGFQGTNADETIKNFETLRIALEEDIYTRLIELRKQGGGGNKRLFNACVDELEKHKWGVLRQAKYSVSIMGFGALIAGAKAFAGVKAGEFVGEALRGVGEEVSKRGGKAVKNVKEFIEEKRAGKPSVPKVKGAGLDRHDVGGVPQRITPDTQGFAQPPTLKEPIDLTTGGGGADEIKGAGVAAEDVISAPRPPVSMSEEQLAQAKGVGGATAEEVTTKGVVEENFFDQFEAEGKAIWTEGAEAGKDVLGKIDRKGLIDSFPHGQSTISVEGAYRNLFGHLKNEVGKLTEEEAKKIAEDLRDTLLVDQQDSIHGTMNIARMISDPLRVAASADDLRKVLSEMDHEKAMHAARYIYAEGLISTQNVESRKVLIDFIMGRA